MQHLFRQVTLFQCMCLVFCDSVYSREVIYLISRAVISPTVIRLVTKILYCDDLVIQSGDCLAVIDLMEEEVFLFFLILLIAVSQRDVSQNYLKEILDLQEK